MNRLGLLVTLTTFLAGAMGAPSSQPHRLVARDGPCDASSETCRPVLMANACFAAYILFGDREQVLRCVDHEDLDRAEELVSSLPCFLLPSYLSSRS